MKRTLYSMMLAGGLMFFTTATVRAAPACAAAAENPTEALREATARASAAETKAAATEKSTSSKSRKPSAMSRSTIMAALGLGESRSVTTPLQRQRRLYALQKQLHAKARMEARARRARCGQPLR